MSYDDYDRSPRRHKSDRRHKQPKYEEEEIIEARGPAAARRGQVMRRQDSDYSIEEVRRDFHPGGGDVYARRSTKKSAVRSGKHGGRYSDDEEYYDNRRRNDKRYNDQRSR